MRGRGQGRTCGRREGGKDSASQREGVGNLGREGEGGRKEGIEVSDNGGRERGRERGRKPDGGREN